MIFITVSESWCVCVCAYFSDVHKISYWKCDVNEADARLQLLLHRISANLLLHIATIASIAQKQKQTHQNRYHIVVVFFFCCSLHILLYNKYYTHKQTHQTSARTRIKTEIWCRSFTVSIRFTSNVESNMTQIFALSQRFSFRFVVGCILQFSLWSSVTGALLFPTTYTISCSVAFCCCVFLVLSHWLHKLQLVYLFGVWEILWYSTLMHTLMVVAVCWDDTLVCTHTHSAFYTIEENNNKPKQKRVKMVCVNENQTQQQKQKNNKYKRKEKRRFEHEIEAMSSRAVVVVAWQRKHVFFTDAECMF